jgi:limonene-1,2-epoxide hydrolase
MCELVAEDVEYDNEPLPPEKKIHGREQFRKFFESSPCIWCDEAELRELRVGIDSVNGQVLTERLDRFKIDGKWLEIPICGAFDVVDGKVKRWKDYWDYAKYNERKALLFGRVFALFRPPQLAAPSRWVVICSPVSGKKEGRNVVEQQLLPTWKKVAPGVDLNVVYTERFQHAMELAQQYGSKDCGIVAVGGDGTIHEVIYGLDSKGVLAETPLAVLSQGTMNFYSITAGLPGPAELPGLVSSNSLRAASLIRVSDGGELNSIAFEALHIGRMPYRVCKGAADFRFTLGPMFGIFANLIACNAVASLFCQSGVLSLHPADGSKTVRKIANFFWIVASHRNPYNG